MNGCSKMVNECSSDGEDFGVCNSGGGFSGSFRGRNGCSNGGGLSRCSHACNSSSDGRVNYRLGMS